MAGAYALLVVGTAVYQLLHGRPFSDIAPGLIVRFAIVGLVLLLVVKYRDSAGAADATGIRGFAQKDVSWNEVEAIATEDDEAVLVLTDGTNRRTRFPASFAQQLADLGGKPLR